MHPIFEHLALDACLCVAQRESRLAHFHSSCRRGVHAMNECSAEHRGIVYNGVAALSAMVVNLNQSFES